MSFILSRDFSSFVAAGQKTASNFSSYLGIISNCISTMSQADPNSKKSTRAPLGGGFANAIQTFLMPVVAILLIMVAFAVIYLLIKPIPKGQILTQTNDLYCPKPPRREVN